MVNDGGCSHANDSVYDDGYDDVDNYGDDDNEDKDEFKVVNDGLDSHDNGSVCDDGYGDVDNHGDVDNDDKDEFKVINKIAIMTMCRTKRSQVFAYLTKGSYC